MNISIVCEAGIRFVYPQVPDLAELLARDGHAVEVLGPVDVDSAAWHGGRGFDYVGVLARGRRGWLFNLGFIALALWRCRRADRVIACTTVALVVALAARALFARPFAFYALECQIPGERGAGGYAGFQHLLRFGAPLVAATGEHRARLMARFLGLRTRPCVVENTALLTMSRTHVRSPRDVRADTLARTGRDPGFLVVLDGGLGWINAVDVVLDAAAALPDDMTIAMFGPVESAVRREIEQSAERGRRVVYLGTLAGDRAELIAYLRTADIGVVLKRGGAGRSLNDRFYTPNKLFDFVAAGVPIVCSGQASMRHLVRDGLAVALPQLTAQALLECLRAVRGMSDARRAEWRERIAALHRARYHFEHDAAALRAYCAAA